MKVTRVGFFVFVLVSLFVISGSGFNGSLVQAQPNDQRLRPGAMLRGVDFSKADLRNSDLRKADLSGANLSGANLSGAQLSGAKLVSANLSGAILQKTNLMQATLNGSNFQGADLRQANLSDAKLKGVNLKGANLSKANLNSANLSGANLHAVNLKGANLALSNLRKVNFSRANLDGADLNTSNLREANLSEANLAHANLNFANLIQADLRGADLSQAQLKGTRLKGVNFSGANLNGTVLIDADLKGAKISEAQLSGAILEKVTPNVKIPDEVVVSELKPKGKLIGETEKNINVDTKSIKRDVKIPEKSVSKKTDELTVRPQVKKQPQPARETFPRLYMGDRVRALGPDLTAIFRFVSDEVGYNAYAGVLRSARGTLWSEAGNSYDQSVLLATLLHNAEMSYRFATCSLGAAKVKRLIQDMFIQPDLTDDEKRKFMKRVAKDEFVSEFFPLRVERDYLLIEEALTQAGIEFKKEASAERRHLEKVVSDHMWVQVKKDGKWVDLDPSFRGAKIGQTFCKSAQTTKTIPAEKFHRVTIKVRLEEKSGGGIKVSYPLSYKARAKDLLGKNVMFLHEEQAGTGGMFNKASGTKVFTPLLFIDNEEIKGKPITIQTGKGLGGLFGGGASREPVAEWLEFEFHDPSGNIKKVERALFDRVGYAPRANGKSAGTKMQPLDYNWFYSVSNMAVVTGKVPPEFFQEKARTEKKPGYFRAVVLGATLFNHSVHFQRTLLPALFFEDKDVKSYIDGPSLTITTVSERQNKENDTVTSVSIDFAHKSRRTVTLAPDRIPPYERIFEGVLDFNVERAFLEQFETLDETVAMDGSIPAYRNVGMVFDLAIEEKIPFTVITEKTVRRLKALELSSEAKARAKASLAKGNVVIVPTAMVPGPPDQMVGWWVIDPVTGLTEDEMDDGRHQAMSEKGNEEADNSKKIGMANRHRCVLKTGFTTLLSLTAIVASGGGLMSAAGVGQGAVGCNRPGPNKRPGIERKVKAPTKRPPKGFTTAPRGRRPFTPKDRTRAITDKYGVKNSKGSPFKRGGRGGGGNPGFRPTRRAK